MGPGERRRELLACAMRLFAEEGYDNVSAGRGARRRRGAGLAYHYSTWARGCSPRPSGTTPTAAPRG